MDPIIRIDEGEDAPVPFSWDTVWRNDAGCGDYAIADETDPEQSRGGLRSADPVGTAISIIIGTALRRPDGIASPDDSDDRRGWFGDSFDIDEAAGEGPLGSLLWVLSRGPIDPPTLKMLVHYAADALQTLVDQGAVDHFEISTDTDNLRGIVFLLVVAFAPTGEAIFSDAFPLQ